MRLTDTSDLWWKTAVMYNLDVAKYLDWNDDGVGDLDGLAHRLDYLADVGITCLWLAPFYPSPQRDNGYDISDYYGVDPRYGHLGDFVEVVRTAKDRGMRVIIDLVVPHTSDQHEWFRSARSSVDSPFRDFYFWADEVPDDAPANIFPDTEDGVWSYDEVAGQYYRHSYFHHQPDLDTGNPRVREEIAKVIGFWLQLGVDGFRVDSVPNIVGRTNERADAEDGHEFLRTLRRYVARRSGTGMMLGEVNVPYAEQVDYFGGEDGDELTMQFDFVANQALYLSLARQDATPLVEAIASRPTLAIGNQWGNFARNHDELTLDQLTDDERDEVFAAFAPDESMRIHGRGIRRRLPSMLDGDLPRIRMVYSLIFSLPGAPVLYYGEEIGMGENLDIPGRSAVRTPMQWIGERNGGFSDAAADDLVSPMVDGSFGPAEVNVSAQRHLDDSLLAFVRVLAQRYRSSPEIGWGELELLEQPHSAVIAHSVRSEIGQMIALHKFGTDAVAVPITLADSDGDTVLIDLLDAGRDAAELRPDANGGLDIRLGRYGYVWYRVIRPGDKRLS